jgi:single-stranded-DNA-specific exonuclease
VRISHENQEKFCQKMSSLVEEELKGKEIVPILEIDAEISPEDIDWEFVTDLKKMEPFGQGNRDPLFCMKNMCVVDFKVVGNGEKHLKLSLRGEGTSPKIFEAIGFSMAPKFPDLAKDDKIDVAFNLSEDEWNGNKKIQMKVVDMKVVGKARKP